jgi:hypothetical protein
MVVPGGPLAVGGVSVGVAHSHCVVLVEVAVVVMPAQACKIATAVIVATISNERVILFITAPSVAFFRIFRQRCFGPVTRHERPGALAKRNRAFPLASHSKHESTGPEARSGFRITVVVGKPYDSLKHPAASVLLDEM